MYNSIEEITEEDYLETILNELPDEDDDMEELARDGEEEEEVEEGHDDSDEI